MSNGDYSYQQLMKENMRDGYKVHLQMLDRIKNRNRSINHSATSENRLFSLD